MAYQNNYNRGGNNGNRQGGNYQNNRGNNSYGRGNSSGGNRSGNFRGGSNGSGESKYVRSSKCTKTIVEDYKKIGDEPAPRIEVDFEPGITEEFAISFKADTTQALLKKIQEAINDPQGDGGIRITMFCQRKVAQASGEEFNGASMLVVGKFPSRNGGGSFNNGNRGGRRDYPDRQGGSDGYADDSRNNQVERRPSNNAGLPTQTSAPDRQPGNRVAHQEETDSGNVYDQGGQDSGYSETPGW